MSCGDSSKKPNIHVCDWHPRRTGRGQKKVFEEIRTRHFSKFHENYKRTPNTRRGKPRHIIIKLLKNHKRKNLKRSQREKKIPFVQRNKNRNGSRFLTRNGANKTTVEQTWQRIKPGPGVLYSTSTSFKIKGKRKTFLDRQKQKELITTRPALQETLKKIVRQKDIDTRWISRSTQWREEH